MAKKKADKLAARAENEEAKKVVLMADFGKVYVKVKGDQILKPVKAQMALLDKMGHFYKIKNEYAISSSGYTHLNRVASINIVTPQKVTVDGVEQANPHIERNDRTKLIESVHVRKIGIGYSPAGNITIIDKTLFYNIYSYFIQSIQAKMKKVEWKDGKPTDKKIHPDCAIIGMANKKPEKDGSWAFFETASPLGLWVNYEDPAIIDCLEEHTQRQRFGDRIAQTIVERNILKDHPAIGISRIHPKKSESGIMKAHVTVYGYRHDFGPPQINEILAQAEKGSETLDVEAEVVDEINHEEEREAIKETAKGEKTPAEMEEPPPDLVLESEKPEEEEK